MMITGINAVSVDEEEDLLIIFDTDSREQPILELSIPRLSGRDLILALLELETRLSQKGPGFVRTFLIDHAEAQADPSTGHMLMEVGTRRWRICLAMEPCLGTTLGRHLTEASPNLPALPVGPA